MIALPATPRELRNRIHVWTFGVSEDLETFEPQHHGGFFEFDGETKKTGPKFWAPAFWDPAQPHYLPEHCKSSFSQTREWQQEVKEAPPVP